MDTIYFEFLRTKINPEDYDGEPPYTYELDLNLYINNKKFCFQKEKNYFLNISGLESAMQESCKYPIFVCGCGDEGCAGIFNTPKIIVSDSTIIWEIYEPEQLTFTFDKAQIFAAIKTLKESMLKHYSIEEWKQTLYLGMEDAGYFLQKNPITD